MKPFHFISIILLITSTISCKVLSYSELPEPNIKTRKFKLKGWQGLSDKRNINFGGYYTKNHHRGASLDNTSLFLPSLTENISGLKEVQFQQFIPSGDSSKLYAQETLNRKGIELHELDDSENANHIIYEHKVRGIIQFEKDSTASFEIDLNSDKEQSIFSEGKFKNMKINYFNYYEDNNGGQRRVIGADILYDSKVIAAFRQGKDGAFEYERCWVWIQKREDINENLVLASLISLLADRNRVDIHGKL